MKGVKLVVLLTAVCILITGCSWNASVSGSTAENSQSEIIHCTVSDNSEESSTDNTASDIVTETYNSRFALSNPNADANTRKLYDYINDIYGTYIITCQQESTWMGSPDYEMDYIFETTGKYPQTNSI